MILTIVIISVVVFVLGLFLGFQLCREVTVKPLMVVFNIIISFIKGEVDADEALKQLKESEEKHFGTKK